MDKEERAKELISSIEYINIATVNSQGAPWNTPVYGVFDGELQFYWSSWKEAEHSINLVKNPEIFCTLYDSTRKRGDNNRRCLYLKGQGVEVTDTEEIGKALELLYGDEDTPSNPSDFTGEGLRRIYKGIPEEGWLNDKSERQVTKETIKMRVDISLQELRDLF